MRLIPLEPDPDGSVPVDVEADYEAAVRDEDGWATVDVEIRVRVYPDDSTDMEVWAVKAVNGGARCMSVDDFERLGRDVDELRAHATAQARAAVAKWRAERERREDAAA
jgi:hypothetical protein